MKSIDATSISFRDFFIAEGDLSLKKYVSPRLLVPSFQRNYVWDSKHVRDLIESVNDNSKEYYIGNVLVQNRRTCDLIIDGQQRITTIFLIIKALELELTGRKKKAASEILFYNKSKGILRVEFTRTNLTKAFNQIIRDNDFDESNFEDENSRKFLNNFNSIKKELRKIADINSFFEKIISLAFVVIKFDEGFDVNQLFEGLNSKGKALSPIQLTKNVLMGTAKKSGVEDDVIDIWEEIEKSFENSKMIGWFDKFLRHDGFYKYDYVSNKDLFKKIKRGIVNDNVFNFSTQLKDDSALYLKIRTADISKKDISEEICQGDWLEIKQIIEHISKMELEQVFAVIYSSFKFAKINRGYRKGIHSRFYRDIYRIWIFSILTKYLDTKPSLFERNFANYSHNLFLGEYKKSQKNFDVFKEILSSSNKNKFVENLNTRVNITGENEKKLNSGNDRNYITPLILFYLTDGREFVVHSLTIEHIVPKGDLSKWRIKRKYLNDVKKSRPKIGNLTLLEQDKLGNESFEQKNIFYKKSKYPKNRKIWKEFKEFNSDNPLDAINNRGVEIASTLYDILIKKYRI